MKKKIMFGLAIIMMIVGAFLVATCGTCSAQETDIEEPEEDDDDGGYWKLPNVLGSLKCIGYVIGLFLIIGGFIFVLLPSIAGGPLVLVVFAASIIVIIYYIFWVMPPECRAF